MERVIRYFARHGRVTFLITLFLCVAGVLGLLQLRRESLPPVDFATALIETNYPGASPDEVEDLVTLKIEEELRGVDGVKEVRSESASGTSEISVILEPDGIDTDQAMNDVQNAVQRVSDLPADLPESPRFTRLRSEEIPVLEFALVGDGPGRARDAAAENLEDLLEDVEGVSDVRLDGYHEREITVSIDLDRLRALNVSKDEITAALASRLKDIPGGYLETPTRERLVRVLGKTADPRKISEATVRANFEGGKITIGDVARVTDGSAEPRTLARAGGLPATLLTVTKRGEADTLETVGRLRAKLDSARLPEGMRIVVYNNEEARVQNRLSIVQQNALLGLAFILAVLLLLLPGTIGFVASVSVPLIVFSLTAGMAALGFTFNAITMIATVIVLGILVDNSAVVAESYARNRAEGLLPLDAATRAAAVFFVPILATVLCNMAGFAPLLVTSGILGKFIAFIPIVIGLALLFSLAETFLLLPARLKFTLHRKVPPHTDAGHFDTGWFGGLQHGFHGVMRALLRHRVFTLAGVAAFFASAIAVTALFNRFELFPKDQVEIYTARFETPNGTPLTRTDALGAELSRAAGDALRRAGLTFDAIIARAGVSRIGPEDAQGRVAHNVGFLSISVPIEAAQEQDAETTLRALRSVRVPGLTKLGMDALVNGPPVGKPLNIVFRSLDEDQLRGMAEAFRGEIAKLPGAFNVEDDLYRGAREVRLDLDLDLMRRAGITVDQVGTAVRTGLQGTVVSLLTLKNREVEVRVRGESSDRNGQPDLRTLPIAASNGQLMTLGSIARFSQDEGPVVRKRFDFQRAITVTADTDPARLTSLAINARAREIIAGLQPRFPDVSFLAGGEEENTRESLNSLFAALVLSLLAILGILVVLYNSFGHALLVLSTIPLGLAGVSYIFWFAARPLGFMALIGVIALGGVVVNASIVLLSFIDERRRAEPEGDVIAQVADVTALRFKAVFITNATTIMGLLPTAYGFGGDDPLLVPLTLSMGWGLLIGSAMALIWVPCGYVALEDFKGALRKWKARRQREEPPRQDLPEAG